MGRSENSVDASGNVYVIDQQLASNPAASGLFKAVPANGSYIATMIATPQNQPNNVAVDAAGNVYMLEIINNIPQTSMIVKETLQPDGTYASTTLLDAVANYYAFALDNWGNAYTSIPGQTSPTNRQARSR